MLALLLAAPALTPGTASSSAIIPGTVVAQPRLEAYEPDHANQVFRATGESLNFRMIGAENTRWCSRGMEDAQKVLALRGEQGFPTRTGATILRTDAFANASALRQLTPSSGNGGFPAQPPMPEQHKPVLWMHVHKNAGSSLCMLARSEKERIIGLSLRNSSKGLPVGNCNLCGDNCCPPIPYIWHSSGKFNDCTPAGFPVTTGPHQLNADQEWAFWQWWLAYDKTCDKRRNEGKRTSFMAIERWMDNELCDGVVYGTMLRDPMDRIISNTHFAWGIDWKANTSQIMRLLEPGAEGCPADTLPRGSRIDEPVDKYHPWKHCLGGVGCNAMERSVAAYDNLYVRTLVGKDAFKLPAGSLTREHLLIAKERLSRFSVVMTLDNWNDDSTQLQAFFGWNKPALHHDNMDRHNDGNPFTPEQTETLVAANQLDYELYCYARLLAKSRTSVANRAIEQQRRQHEAAGRRQ